MRGSDASRISARGYIKVEWKGDDEVKIIWGTYQGIAAVRVVTAEAKLEQITRRVRVDQILQRLS